MNDKLLVVLGSSVTALAVLRHAASIGMQLLLIDTEQGVASYSRYVKGKAIFCNADHVLQNIAIRANCVGTYIIPTSDYWLKYLRDQRIQLLEQQYTLLCPSNEVIDICIDKQMFTDWCKKNSFSIPQYREQASGKVDEFAHELLAAGRRVFIRPGKTSTLYSDIPKALSITSEEEYLKWVRCFSNRSVPYVVTESLLGDTLSQYAFGFARREEDISSVVTLKNRPSPEECSVGSYVQVVENAEITKLGERVCQALNYFGVGEIEILYSHERNEYFLIEINARPWMQYPLSLGAERDFLCVLIEEKITHLQRAPRKLNWIDFSSDLYLCFSRSVGYVRTGRLGWFDYIKSLVTIDSCAVFSWQDPMPFVKSLLK